MWGDVVSYVGEYSISRCVMACFHGVLEKWYHNLE